MARWLVALTPLLLTGCFNGLLLKPTYCGGPVEETVMADADWLLCRDKVAVIDVEGLILNARTSGLLGDGENPVALFRERLEAAAADRHVRAVVLRINSPGGGVTASDIMYEDLVRFREKTHKPVVACLMDVAASGAYYLAMGCDAVYAHPTTVTGSIGVIMSLYNASGLFSMLGVRSDPIKSGPNKDLGNPLRAMTKQERAILQAMVNSFYDQFVKVVAAGRKLPEDKVRELADGRVFTGEEACRLGLVDRIIAEESDPARMLDRYIGLFEATLREGKHDKACLCGMLGAELASLGDEASAAAVAEGRAMSLSRAIAYALEG